MTPSRIPVIAIALVLTLAGCGSNSAIPFITPGTATGNWTIYNVGFNQGSSVNGFTSIGGPFTQTGNALTVSLHITSPCFGNGQTPIPLTGAINQENNQFSLTSASVAGETVVLQGTFSSARDTFNSGYLSLSGACTGYLVSQTGDDDGAILNPRGTKIPSLTGTWAFADAYPGPTLSEQLTQSTTPDSQGRFTLTGTASISGSPCFSTGTLQPGSYLTGSTGQQVILLNDGSTLTSPVIVSAPVGYLPSLQLYPGTISGGNCNGPANIDLQETSPAPAMKQYP